MIYAIIDDFVMKVLIGRKDWETPFRGIKTDSIEEIETKIINQRMGTLLTQMIYDQYEEEGKFKGIKGWLDKIELKLGINQGKISEKILRKILKNRKRAEESAHKD